MYPINVNISLPSPISLAILVSRPNISLAVSIPQSSGSSSGLTEDTMAEYVATEDITIYQVITSNGKVANSNTLNHRSKVIGISKTTTVTGFTGQVQIGGVIENPGWALTPYENVFLNGTAVSNTPPATGFTQRIGKALSATKIIIDIDEPITL